ncbi:MAG: AraC family transcriptional regulator [Clostridia bacterium]|nr:AraC family transcriptional regulator [Clostridia bacterium]
MKVTYIKTNLDSILSISKIVTVHYYEFDKSFVFEGERHDFWELVYIDKGMVEVCQDTERITLHQGEIAFHRPNEFHSIRALGSDPNFFVISFVCHSPAMAHFVRYHATLEQSLRVFITSIIKEAQSTYRLPKNDPHLDRLSKRPDAPVGGEQLIKLYLEQLLILLIRKITNYRETGIFPNKDSMENHLVIAVKEMIEERVGERIRIPDICTRLGYSRSYLSKLFHDFTGETIGGYATSFKISRAKALIRTGNYNFSEISDMLAFDTPQYFCRVFKRSTGMTPTEFRQSLKLK